MSSKKFLLAGLAALSLAALNVNAQLAGTAISATTNGDLILAFQGAGANDLLVDLGSFSQFQIDSYGGTAVAGTTYSLGAFNSTDVTKVFSAGATNWTVLGSTGAGNGFTTPGDNSLFLSSSSTLAPASTGLQKGPSGNIDLWVQNTIAASTSTVSGLSADAVALSLANGFTGLAFTNWQGTNIIGSAAGTSILDLYQLSPTDVTGKSGELGFFTLNSTAGTLTFTAVPEPSTYAALLGLATLGVVLIRRRRQVAIEA